MDSKIKIMAMVALVAVAALAFWFLRPTPGGTDGDETTGGSANQDPDGVATSVPPIDEDEYARSLRTPPDIIRNGDPSARGDDDTDDPGDEDGGGPRPGSSEGASLTHEPGPADYLHAPIPALDARITRATTELPESRQIQGVTILCLTGGTDCRVTGVSATPQDLRTFAETLESAPAAEGEDAAPTVEINSTESMSSGMTDFELGVYYP